VTNYGKFLEVCPPEFEVEIVENTSWSCAHGWSAGDRTADATGQALQPALARAVAQALDELRDAIAPLTEEAGNKVFRDVWAARDAYIDVVLDRDAEATERFS